MRKNSVKHVRIEKAVHREISNIIREEVKDPRVGIMTSVTAVEVAPDLKTCKAYISVFGTDEEKSEAVKALQNAEGFIRRALAANLNLRNTPKITFIPDDSIEYGVNMSNLIDKVIENSGESSDEQN